MTQAINLQPVPNQQLSVTFGDIRYNLTLKSVGQVMALDLTIDDRLIYSGLRIVAGTPLIPYRYQEAGNFIFITLNNCLPFYTRFGEDQTLIWASPAELVALRG